MYSRANRNHFGRLLSFEDQGQHINRDAATKVFKKLHISSGINLLRWYSIMGCGVLACPTWQMAHFCTKMNLCEIFFWYIWLQVKWQSLGTIWKYSASKMTVMSEKKCSFKSDILNKKLFSKSFVSGFMPVAQTDSCGEAKEIFTHFICMYPENWFEGYPVKSTL